MRFIYSSAVYILFITFSLAQNPQVQLKNVSDTILNTNRTLKVDDPIDALKTMQKLFPGKPYNLEDQNVLISWNCKNCKPKNYIDANGTEGDQLFPYKEGVATRLLANIDYSDSKGNQFKIFAFNHSFYDEDGLQTSRFTGGLLGLAKFAKSGNSWQMKSFQPAVAAFGAFSQCPKPKLLQIGEDQYALTIVHANGGAGGPYDGYLYLIVGLDGKYQSIMEVPNYLLTNSGSSAWSSTYTVSKNTNKKYFRDIIIKTNGNFNKTTQHNDEFKVNYPEEIAPMTKTKKQFDFEIERRFTFNGKRYNLIGKPIVKFSNIK
ncbi:hypothetical protein [Flavobacterium aquicola]|uniref:Uncharacterized protein n=1 Tax=Flavobacterium aquicola TaxID=1682742 RepID=A0A3E0EG66_9FLAO|nr:hypothetical protein [Flavobacterium aquicola]REG96056.1 hypothetical protein C8P67_11128 [Flavobacterium aquicola]